MIHQKLKPHLHLRQTSQAGQYELSILLDLDGQYELEDGWPDTKGNQTYVVKLIKKESGYTCTGITLTDLAGTDETVSVELQETLAAGFGTNLLGKCTVHYATAERPEVEQDAAHG